jgi:hypothetical protein
LIVVVIVGALLVLSGEGLTSFRSATART